jgi:D-tagatose-1,6-bisphosphate aldolase subunit GatZ/KbaZ
MRCADDPPSWRRSDRGAFGALCIVAEAAAAQVGLPPPVYVIGTEVPIPGGEANLAQAGAVTSPKAAAHAGRAPPGLHGARPARRLAPRDRHGGAAGRGFRPQPDPALRGRRRTALSAFIAGQPGIVFEAHSTDYQRETALHAWCATTSPSSRSARPPPSPCARAEALCAIEAELLPASQCSRLMQVLDDAMLAQPKHWPSTIRAQPANSACCAATA